MPKKEAISATRRRMVGVSMPRLSRPKASSCQTLSVTIWFSGDCWTKPIFCAWVRWSRQSSGCPSKRISPVLVPWGARTVFSCRSSVDFPQPEGPQSTTNAPDRMVRLRPSMAFSCCSG